MSVRVERHTAVLDGSRVSYLRADPDDGTGRVGERPPVVLLHGGGLDAANLSWAHVQGALAARLDRTVYAPDWPGYGESDPPEAEPDAAYYVGVLGAFLDALDAERAALVGISMGGGVALGYALDRPGRVSRLVAVDSYGLGGTVPGGSLGALFVRLGVSSIAWRAIRRSRLASRLAIRAVVAPGNCTSDLVADVRRALDRPDAGRAFERFQRSEVGVRGLRTNHLDRLPALAVPTLFVHGERDPLVPVAWAVRAAVLAPDADLRVLGGCGHWPPREVPGQFRDVVVRFLDG